MKRNKRQETVSIRTFTIGFCSFLAFSILFSACAGKKSAGCAATSTSSGVRGLSTCQTQVTSGLTGGATGVSTGTTINIPSVSTSTGTGESSTGETGASTNATTGEFPFPATGSTAGTNASTTGGADSTTTAGATAGVGGNSNAGTSATAGSSSTATAGSTAGSGNPPSQDGNLMLQPTEYNLAVDTNNQRRELWIGPDYGEYPVTLINTGSFDARDVHFVIPQNVGLYAENDSPCPNLLQFQTCVIKLHIGMNDQHGIDTARFRAGNYTVIINANYLDANGYRRYLSIPMRWFAKRAIQAVGTGVGSVSAADIRELFSQKRIGGGVLAFEGAFQGGVRTAICDINGDGHDDLIMAAGPGGGPRVTIVNGLNPSQVLFNFFAYDPAYRGGVSVACGKVVQGSNRNYLVTGAWGLGAPHVNVWDTSVTPNQNQPGAQPINAWYAFPNFAGGVSVAVADVDGDHVEDIIRRRGQNRWTSFYAAKRDGTPIWSPRFAFDPSATMGIWVAGADLDGDGKAEVIVTPQEGGGPVNAIFNATDPVAAAFTYPSTNQSGVSVAAGFGQIFNILTKTDDF